MYDKYFQANPITIGSRIPKHKGILFSGAPTTGAGVTLSLVSSGGTFNTYMLFNSTPNFFPMQVYTIPTALPAGLTAYYVN
jgi:hypothetical protein